MKLKVYKLSLQHSIIQVIKIQCSQAVFSTEKQILKFNVTSTQEQIRFPAEK